MKRLTVAAATIASLVLAGAPALAADSNQGSGNDTNKKNVSGIIQFVGTVKSVVDTATITVLVSETTDAKATKDITKAMRRATVVVKADSATVVTRAGVTAPFTAIAVKDRVNVRARCTLGTPIVCLAKRVNAFPPKLHLGLAVRGTVVSNTAGVLGVVVVVPGAIGDDSALKARAIIGTTLSFQTDTKTVVTKAGATVTVASLTGFPAVNVSGSCTATTPVVCTARRIIVLVPTA